MNDPVVLERTQLDVLLKLAARYRYILGEDEQLTPQQWQAVKDALEERGYVARVVNTPVGGKDES